MALAFPADCRYADSHEYVRAEGDNWRLGLSAFAIDQLGDIYLVGRLPLTAITQDELDRLLGSVLRAADESFNTLLRLGFGTAIRRERAWREARGESVANLAAFDDLR